MPRLACPKFICCAQGPRFYFYSWLERARDLSADFRRVAQDNVMRGEVPLRDRPTKRKHKERGAFLSERAPVYQAWFRNNI